MNTKKFSEAMNEIDGKYVEEAIGYGSRKAQKTVWMKWGAMAACLCLMVVGGILFARSGNHLVPNPDPVQIPNPILTVTSVEEMEEYLDFPVLILDKEVASYSVMIEDSYPTMGQVDYADGSQFRIRYGSGDISGIYGGTLEKSEDIQGVKVQYYKYADTAYAIWEQNGFAFSYIYVNGDTTDVERIITQYR